MCFTEEGHTFSPTFSCLRTHPSPSSWRDFTGRKRERRHTSLLVHEFISIPSRHFLLRQIPEYSMLKWLSNPSCREVLTMALMRKIRLLRRRRDKKKKTAFRPVAHRSPVFCSPSFNSHDWFLLKIFQQVLLFFLINFRRACDARAQEGALLWRSAKRGRSI